MRLLHPMRLHPLHRSPQRRSHRNGPNRPTPPKPVPERYSEAAVAYEASKWEVLGNRSLIAYSDQVLAAVSLYRDNLEQLQKALPNAVIVKSKRDFFFYDANTALLFREIDPQKKRPLHICLYPTANEEDEDKTQYDEEEDRTRITALPKNVKDRDKMYAIHKDILNHAVKPEDIELYVRAVPPTYSIVTRLQKHPQRSEAVERWISLPYTGRNYALHLPAKATCVKFIRSKLYYLNSVYFDLDQAYDIYQKLKLFCSANAPTHDNMRLLMKFASTLCRMVHTCVIPELLQWVHSLIAPSL